MKKWLLWFGGLLIIFIGLIYASLSSTTKTFKTCDIVGSLNLDTIDFKAHDSVLITASTLYAGNVLKDLMQGEQYRKAWATPIRVPIAFLDTLIGGMHIIEEGGGKQTHSLELASKNGYVFTLRSINKDPTALIPEFAKTLGLENIVVDGISAQHPYAAVVVAKLSESAGVVHTDPQIVFVPKQAVLGSLNDKYGNRLFLLEHETEGGANWTPYDHVDKIVDTKKLQALRMELGKAIQIEKPALVRARLFDILIGDWDRHAKQWGWAIQNKGDSYVAYPIAGDRDNAFFHIGGILPNIISNRLILPGLQSFEKDIDFLPGLVMPFDVYFLKNTPESIFINEANALKNAMTDSIIEAAFRLWPPAIYDLDAEEIISTIRARREHLDEYARDFKNILDNREYLSEPLKGSEGGSRDRNLVKCFECD